MGHTASYLSNFHSSVFHTKRIPVLYGAALYTEVAKSSYLSRVQMGIICTWRWPYDPVLANERIKESFRVQLPEVCLFLQPLSFVIPSLRDKKADSAWEVQSLSHFTLRIMEQEDREAQFFIFCNLEQLLLSWIAYLHEPFYGRKLNLYVVKSC